SVSHMGFCVLGLAMLNLQSVQGALIQLINHGVSTAALFFLVALTKCVYRFGIRRFQHACFGDDSTD
ncbi:MAG: hypothetical protein KBD95_07810, partial [Veillonella sp.]|nr:hypothetical protein [Veillonella sp.]